MAALPSSDANEQEQNSLGANAAPGNINAEPTTGIAPGGMTVTGPGGATAINNSVTTTPSQQTGGERPTLQSQVADQGNITPNIQPYETQANQNAIANASTGVTNTLTGETQQAQQETNAANQNLQNDVTAGTPQLNPTVNSNIANNPTNVSSSDLSTLDKELSGTYSGPTSASSYYTNAGNAASTAAQNAAVLEQPNIAGPETYFQQQGVKGQGNDTLDAALYEQNPAAQQQARPAILSAQAAPATVSGAELMGQNVTIPSGTTNAQATQSATQQALGNAITNYTNQGNSAVSANVAAYNNLAATTQKFLQNPTLITGNPSPEQQQALSALGYTTQQWNELVSAYNDLAKIQYVQNLVKTSGMPIIQDPKTGQYVNQLTGQAIVFPSNLPPPAGIDLSKGLTVGEASQLFNLGNSANPQTLADINALEKLLGQSSTVSATPTGPNGTQFSYAPPDLASNVTSAQQSLVNANNEAQAAINQARDNPSAALSGGTTLGVAYAIGGAGLAYKVADAAAQHYLGSPLGTALGQQAADEAVQMGIASPQTVAQIQDAATTVGTALSLIGAAYGIYNFIAGYQSGNSAVDAINGAEAGAAIGSVILPGIGTAIGAVIGGIVGAVSGLFGFKADPEDTYWTSYQNATGTTDANTTQLLANSITDPYLTLAGFFDQHTMGNTPIVSRFGRMGEQSFVTAMVQQIDSAAKSGKITDYSTPQYIYNQVVGPWIKSFGGNWDNGTQEQQLQSLITAMIGQYTAGDVGAWHDINGNNPFTSTIQPFSNFVSTNYNSSQWLQPPLPGNTTSNPIAYANGQAPTQVAGPT